MIRQGGLALAVLASLAGAARAEPANAEEAMAVLSRLVVLNSICQSARINYLALGVLLQRHGLDPQSVRSPENWRIMAKWLDQVQNAVAGASKQEACDLVFGAFGVEGSDVRGLVIAAHPNDIFAFFDALSSGFGGLQKMVGDIDKDKQK